MRPLTSSKPVNIARVANYALTVIHQSFPKATIISFTNLYQALASVSAGQNDYFIGSNIITSSMISRYFTHSLNVVKYYNSPRQYNFFLTRKESVVLNEVLNRFVDALTNEVRYEYTQNWLNTGNLAFLNKPLELTEHEKQWIKQHPDLKVLENPYSPPYSMTDENGSSLGVMGDILNILLNGFKFFSDHRFTQYPCWNTAESRRIGISYPVLFIVKIEKIMFYLLKPS